MTPAAESSIAAEPAAPAIVLRSGVPASMLTLDVSHRAPCTPERIDRLKAGRGAAVVPTRRVPERSSRTKHGWPGPPLHVPQVIARLPAPDIDEGRSMDVTGELASQRARSMTITDDRRVTDRPASATFARDLDADRVSNLLTIRLARLP